MKVGNEGTRNRFNSDLFTEENEGTKVTAMLIYLLVGMKK